MTAGMIVGLILLPFAWMLMAAANKAHRDETGVNAPTRDEMRRIRRNARKKGISEPGAYNQWLDRKTSRLGSAHQPTKNHHIHDPNATLYKKPQATDEGDDALMSSATARNWGLHRQANGRYYILNLNRSPTAFVTFPENRSKHEFSRQEIQRLLAQTEDEN